MSLLHTEGTGTRSLISPVGGIYTTAEAADLLRTSKRTIQRLIRDGRLGAYRLGHGYRILDKHIQAFFVEQEPAPPSAPSEELTHTPDPSLTISRL
jgi:excisionase family DNA binding protein